MKKLFLFDIDRTLISGSASNRFGHTLRNIHGIDIKSDKDFNGYTDYLILAALLEDEGWDDQQIKLAMPELLEELDKVHKETFKTDTIYLLAGVKDLLKTLNQKKYTLGLITGNLESVAERKLEAVDIWGYFTGGGFGSDPHITRSDLVSLAIKRFGYDDHIEDVYVIGDTPRDIIAAKEANISNSVGVANGFRSTQELIDAGAKIVLEDFKDTQDVLRKLEIP